MNVRTSLTDYSGTFYLAGLFFLLMAPCVQAQSPGCFSQPAGPVGETNATLNGMAVARGSSTAAWFEWGADANYGSATALTDIGSNSQVLRLAAPIAGLAPGTLYHYRLVASNSVGITYGMDSLLVTGTKVTTWCDLSGAPFPSIPHGLSNVVVQASGHGHSLAVDTSGNVVAWGVGIPAFYANYGQTNLPAGLSNVVAVAGGWTHSLAVRQDGSVAAWGEYNTPLQPAFVPAGLSNVIAVAGGDSHSLALRSDGTLVAWGGNSSGQTNVPAKLTNIVAIAAGSTHSLALRSDGTVVVWGSDPFANPTAPPSWLSNVVSIASESRHNLALRSDGTVVAWGNNNNGQTNVPAGLSNVVAIAAGYQHSLALKSDGTLVAWGNPTYVSRVPVALQNVAAIASGDYHSLAISPMNLPPSISSRSVSGPMNTDFVVFLSGSDLNGDSIGFRISSPPTNGALYQYAASGRGAPITDPDTQVTDASRVVFAASWDGFGAPYSTFGYVANDGQSDSSPGLVTVNIVPPPVLGPATFSQTGTAGLTLNYGGLSNVSYSIQASTNLLNWTRLGSATQTSPGQFTFLDAGTTNRPYRFYRVTSP